MPSFWTHVAFAEDCKQRILTHDPATAGELTQAICARPHAFYTGMQGPDLFLFYLPAAIRKRKLSSVLHTKETAKLLCRLFARAHAFRGEDRLCALSYVSGFLGHYLLDSHTHAFVYAAAGTDRTARSFCTHNALEADLNRLAVERSLGCSISALPRPCSYTLSKDERRILSDLLSRALCDVYGIACSPAKVSRAFHSVNLFTRILYDPKGSKAKIARLTETPLNNRYFSPLFLGESHYFHDPANLAHSRWIDPYTGESSTESFFDLYDRALSRFVPTLRRLETPALDSPRARKVFFQKLCERDFHGEPTERRLPANFKAR